MSLRGGLIRMLGGTAGPAPARAGAGPDFTEYGATGTPIMSGYLRDLGEYNSELTGLAAYRVYEQMRRSDAQVAATLAAIKLPIRSAGWTIREPEDASPVEKEAADFAKECFLEELDLDAVIRNALLMLDFGVAVHEDVWYIDGNQVRLKKLAPRLPPTFWRWLVAAGTEDLVQLEQQGWRAEQYVRTSIPVGKLAIFTFEQEGSNFAGRALLRPMYQHWYVKNNLYRIDAISLERNGMGVPVITMAADAKAEDRAFAAGWVQRVAANESTGLVLPPGWTFEIKGVQGSLHEPKESIHHHNLQISMAGLSMFMNLGQTTAGARALGETMADFFAMSVQATANQIARTISRTSLQRLIDYNFSGLERYPQLIPAEILSVKFDTIVAALKDLAAGGVNVIQPDDDLEQWIRERMGAPDAAAPRKRPAPPAATPGQPGPTAESQSPQNGKGQPPPDLQPKIAPGAANAGKKAPPADAKGADGSVPIAASEASATDALPPLSREPGTVGSDAARRSEKCLALSEIVSALDKGRDEIAAAMRGARSRVQAEVVNKLVSGPVRNMHRVSIAPDAKLTAEIEQILVGIHDFGAAQVTAEQHRQRAGAPPADAAQIREATASEERRLKPTLQAEARPTSEPTGSCPFCRGVYLLSCGHECNTLAGSNFIRPMGQKEAEPFAAAGAGKRDPLGVYADATVAEFENNLTARAANAALDWRRRPGDATTGEIIRNVEGELDGQRDGWIDGVAAKGANEAFADGRADGYAEHASEIGSVIYSALLDLNCCENCAAADGDEGATPDDITDVPNPDCDGGDKCRCVHVYVFSDEVRNP